MKNGFTLAELLVALLIMGQIAAFTIPKVLVVQQSQKYNAMTKEAAAIASEAFQLHQIKGSITTSTDARALSAYLNYVKKDASTVGALQDNWGNSLDCSASVPCYLMHNGGTILLNDIPFTGSSAMDATQYIFDPDGTGPTKGVWFFLYFNGRITSSANCYAGTKLWGAVEPSCPQTGGDPTWFRW